MILIPAIDLYDGKCVRLHKGDFNQMKSYSDDPVEMAKYFAAIGCTHLHVVDLEGARKGRVIQTRTLAAIASSTNLTIDFGGGIKSDEDVEKVLDSGAQKFTAGSIAVHDESRVIKWIKKYGSDRVILGADALDRKVAINGWNESSSWDLAAFIDNYQGHGISQVICTDISVDGTLAGPSVELYADLKSQFDTLDIIASGGVRDITHIQQLINIGVSGVIVGKAIYEGTLELEKALELC